MHHLTVFYDRHCGLCRACRRWLEGQPKYVELRFVPYQSEEAFRICPSLGEFEPDREIVVLSDHGNLYTGGAAWVMCLYALREYRAWAVRLAHPALLPLAKRICHQVSRNRLRLSKLFFERSVDAITNDVRSMDAAGDSCEFEPEESGDAGRVADPGSDGRSRLHRRFAAAEVDR